GVLEAREPIILADFQNSAGDPVLARAVTEAFRIDLAQSPLVTVVAPSFVEKALSRMQVHPETSLDLDLAREIAIREGIKAVMGGEITTVGAGFVLSAQLVSAEGGEVLAAYRETSKDSTAIIRAIDRLSKKLRERIGESLKTIRANEPLDQVTTASLKALRKYSQAVSAIEEGDASKGRALLEEAVELDTAFAMAWRKLGVVAIGRTRQVEALTKAFQHRDRLTDRERYLTLGTYYGSVTDEREKAITAYRTLLDTYPNDSWALNNLANLYYGARDYTRAEDMYRRAIEADSFSAVSYSNLVSVKFGLGKFEEAEATLERLAEYFPDHPNIASYRINLASARGAYEAAEVQAQAFKEAHKGEVYRQLGANQLLIGLAIVRGRLAEAERLSLEVLDALEKLGLGGGQLDVQIGLASMDVWFRGDTASGQRRVEAAVERTPLEEIDPLNRPYLSLARFYALAGRPDRTHATLAEFDAAVEPELRRDAENDRHGILGIIALNDGRYSDAVEEFRRSDEGACAICVFPGLGLAFDHAGEADSAIAYYEGYVTGPWLFRLDEDAIFLAMCYERLGALYEERGEPEKAIRYYGRLVELWKDADPELKPRVEAARHAIQALSTDRPGGD
ncbi:MAG: tetratricopeptide repeat protein, partial [Gemmatimonadota bacterium]